MEAWWPRESRGRSARAHHDPRRIRTVHVRGRLRRFCHRRGTTSLRRCPRAGREAHDRRSRRLALSPQPARPSDRSGPRPSERRGIPGLHPGLSLLSGGHDHAPGARAARGSGAHDGGGRPASNRLRRGGAHVALERRLLGHRRSRRRPRRRPGGLRQRQPVIAVASCGRVHGRDRQPDPEGSTHRPHVRS